MPACGSTTGEGKEGDVGGRRGAEVRDGEKMKQKERDRGRSKMEKKEVQVAKERGNGGTRVMEAGKEGGKEVKEKREGKQGG